ncbi:hypothetical protein [Actinoplanes sp. NPDC051851]|uniref:hypothetical protein n=1 Tax=Actinoplanes sp. NPDC051851 TaxID=3154753 RepID=UPI00342E2643
MADPVVAGASALRLELPYESDREEYEQILSDTVTLIAPRLGWSGVRDDAAAVGVPEGGVDRSL